jgi:hypothetical protein
LLFAPTARSAEPKPNFSRDVRPILSDNCFQCHGPDEKTRKADLRLDTKDGLAAATKHVLERIASKEADEVMPPPKSGKKLTTAQIATLQAWVNNGAEWNSHWAFTAPVRPAVPKTKFPVANPIDAFIRAKLEAEGLSPAAPAEKTVLLRRVTFDLTGVPPTPDEVAAFLKDDSPNAFEKVVDRLLASPRYGERMAWRWLEAARYADTNGYQTDAGRDMWRWRDWVIEAYNRNLPFDRFTIEQLAGDLLPNPTLDQRIATGFNRNHRGNSEGGIVPEEYAVEYVADRVETTATVWLGLTFTCCRCHDHKFDPFTTKEFYRLFAYFNNVPESGRAWKFGNSPPFIKAPTKLQTSRLEKFDFLLDATQPKIERLREDAEKQIAKWKPDASVTLAEPDLAKHWPLDDAEGGRVGKAMAFDGKRVVKSDKDGDFGFDDRFTLSCWINPAATNGTILSRTTAEPQGEGYTVALVNGKLQIHLTKRWLDDALRIESVDAIPMNHWTHIAVSYDAGRVAAGTKVYVNGSEAKTRVLMDELNQTFQTKEPFRIGGGAGVGFTGRLDEVKLFNRDLEPPLIARLAVAESVAEISKKPAAQRSAAEADKLFAAFVESVPGTEIHDAEIALRKLQIDRRRLLESIPTVMVMEEMKEPRPAHVLIRGDYEKKGEKVTPGVPAMLSSKDAGVNRLGFAKWLMDPANPLTARVAVNRAWQLHFGTGLVKTTEDFGTQGAFPTHPELLDWLAVEFQNGWDIKKLHKLIVMSHTYQQASIIPKDAKDPENKLLSRFPRQRLSPEMVRDQALFASGLVVEKLGGPSVKPYQPPGLWKELSGAADYVQDTGEGLYRRSLYSYWKRTSPPPVLATFDAAGREVCWVRETRTNTPLQALTLMNETGFVEASRKLAERAFLASGGRQPSDSVGTAFKLVLGRTPTAEETVILTKQYEARLADFTKHPDGAKRLLAVGESKTDPKLNPAELAALAVVCGMILNLDEAVTKE